MDPVLITSTVVTALVPYLAKAAEKFTNEFADSVGHTAWNKTGELFGLLKKRLASTPPAESALVALEKAPNDATTQERLGDELKKIAVSDPEFLQQLTMMLESIAKHSGSANFSNQIAGNVEKVIQINNANDIQIS